VRIHLRFDGDFADLFEVRGLKRKRRGTASRSVLKDHQVSFDYQGLDGVRRHTAISLDPPPAKLSTNEAHYECMLPPGEITRVFIAVGCDTTKEIKTTFTRALIGAHRERRAMASDMATVQSSNELLNEVLCRSAAD